MDCVALATMGKSVAVHMKFPWEQETLPAAPEPVAPAVPIEKQVELLTRDFATAVAYTAVLVHSTHPALQILANVPRGQIIPRNEAKLSDGSTIEFQDIGMPQPGAPFMGVPELIRRVLEITQELGLEHVS